MLALANKPNGLSSIPGSHIILYKNDDMDQSVNKSINNINIINILKQRNVKCTNLLPSLNLLSHKPFYSCQKNAYELSGK